MRSPTFHLHLNSWSFCHMGSARDIFPRRHREEIFFTHAVTCYMLLPCYQLGCVPFLNFNSLCGVRAKESNPTLQRRQGRVNLVKAWIPLLAALAGVPRLSFGTRPSILNPFLPHLRTRRAARVSPRGTTQCSLSSCHNSVRRQHPCLARSSLSPSASLLLQDKDNPLRHQKLDQTGRPRARPPPQTRRQCNSHRPPHFSGIRLSFLVLRVASLRKAPRTPLPSSIWISRRRSAKHPLRPLRWPSPMPSPMRTTSMFLKSTRADQRLVCHAIFTSGALTFAPTPQL